MFHVPFEAWHFLEDWLGCQIQFYSVLSVLSSIYLSFEMDVCDILVFTMVLLYVSYEELSYFIWYIM